MDKGDPKNVKTVTQGAPTGYILFVAFIGAAIYFIKLSAGFWGFVLAILKAAVWPAFVLYEVLRILNV